MRQYLADQKRILDADNDLHRAATSATDTHINSEYSLQSLCGAAFRTAQALTLAHPQIRLFQYISFCISNGFFDFLDSGYRWRSILGNSWLALIYWFGILPWNTALKYCPEILP